MQPTNEIKILLVLFFEVFPGSIVLSEYVYNLKDGKCCTNYAGFKGKKGFCGMKRKGNKTPLSLPYIILLVLALVWIAVSQSSFGIDVFQAGRGVNARIVSDDRAFVGIIYNDVYKVVYSNDGNNNYITMRIENNLPYRASYELVLSGLPIKDFTPGRFTLDPNERQLIEIQMLDLEEAVEGIFSVQGYISAEFAHGSVDVAFRFEVEVELPEPESVEGEETSQSEQKSDEIEILHAETHVGPEEDVIEENVIEDDGNKIKEDETDSADNKENDSTDIKNDDGNGENGNEKLTEEISQENLPGEPEDNSNSAEQ